MPLIILDFPNYVVVDFQSVRLRKKIVAIIVSKQKTINKISWSVTREISIANFITW